MLLRGSLRTSRSCVRALQTAARSSLLRPRPVARSAKRGILFKIHNEMPSKICGYFVVFPAIPDETPENNVFLASIARNEEWPPLATSTAKELYEGTVRLLMEHGATVLEHLELLQNDKELPRTFENVVEPLLTELYEVDYAFHTLMLKMLTDWPECSTRAFDIDFDHIKVMLAREHMEKLFDPEFQKALQAIYDNGQDLDKWKLRLVEFFLLEIKALGLDRHDEKSKRIISAWSKMTDDYRTKYLTNILCTNDQHIFNITAPEAIRDAPPHIRRVLSASGKHNERPFRAKMEPNSVHAFLTYCGDRPQRAQLWDRWISKASFEHDFYNNSINVEEIRHNAEGLAKTLGFTSVAEHRLANKMAGSPETVRNFVKELTHRMRPVFIDRMDAWQRYAAEREAITGQLQPFDLFYVCRREALEHYSVDAISLMNYFPFWPTFTNLTEVLSHLMSVKFVDVTDSGVQRAHPSVRVFSVADTTTGEHLGRINVDPFARDGKKGKWNTLLGRPANEARGLDKIVYLVGDAEEPAPGPNGGPDVSLLHYSQLQQLLFHVGRAMQLLLSRSPYRELTVPATPMYAADWDAADLFPKFVEFFLFKPNIVAALSCPHVETGEMLGEESVNLVSLALQRATLWESYRTLFWTDYDLTLFEMEDRRNGFWLDVYRKMYKDYFPFPREKNNYQPCSFTPIFARPPFMSMYYRKLWVEMLALDVHETFNHEADEKATGDRLKAALLNPGASELQGELYRRFQGRDPSVGAICDFYDPPAVDLSEEQQSSS